MDRQQKDKCRRPAKELRQGRWSALTKIRLNLCLNRPGYSRFRGGCVARPYFDNLIIAAVAKRWCGDGLVLQAHAGIGERP